VLVRDINHNPDAATISVDGTADPPRLILIIYFLLMKVVQWKNKLRNSAPSWYSGTYWYVRTGTTMAMFELSVHQKNSVSGSYGR
jgi:hypothetical protein